MSIKTVNLTTYHGVIESLNLVLAGWDIKEQTPTEITFVMEGE